MMKDGEVCETGTYESLMKFESNTMKLMKEYGKRKDNTTDDSENVPTTTATTAATTASSISEKGSRSGSTTKINTVASGKIEAAAVGGGGGAAATAAGKALVAKEETAKGSVSWNVYKAYGEACSWSSVIMYIIIAMLSQVIAIGQNLFLADWAKTNDGNSTVGGGDKEYVWRLSVYGGLGILFR